MLDDPGFSERWKLSIRLTGRGFLIALVGFSISLLGMLPLLMVLGLVGYVVTGAGVVVGFVGMFAPPTSSIFQFVWRKSFRKEPVAENS